MAAGNEAAHRLSPLFLLREAWYQVAIEGEWRRYATAAKLLRQCLDTRQVSQPRCRGVNRAWPKACACC